MQTSGYDFPQRSACQPSLRNRSHDLGLHMLEGHRWVSGRPPIPNQNQFSGKGVTDLLVNDSSATGRSGKAMIGLTPKLTGRESLNEIDEL
jgi:hypothetical protein